MPTTLIQPLRLVSGDRVYVRENRHAFVTAYEPCRVLAYQEEEIVVQVEKTGEIMPVHLSAIGVVPSGYEIRDEKLVKL